MSIKPLGYGAGNKLSTADDGSSLGSLNGSGISSGTVDVARLPSGVQNANDLTSGAQAQLNTKITDPGGTGYLKETSPGTVTNVATIPASDISGTLSPSSVPPYGAKVYGCPSGAVPGSLMAIGASDDTLVLADRDTLTPTPLFAVAIIYDKPTSTTCRVYVLNVPLSSGGFAVGTRLYLGTSGALSSSVASGTVSGQINQSVGVADSSTTYIPNLGPWNEVYSG